MPADLTAAACAEVERGMQAGQWEMELQHSFYSSRRGRLNRKPGPGEFPACFALMRAAEDAFGVAACDDDKVQVAIRRYVPAGGTRDLHSHIDSTEMFGEPVLSVVLRPGGIGDGLNLWPARRPKEGEAFLVDEAEGVALCLEGPARYEYVHAVPAVAAERISMTWRWFKDEYYERLLERASERQRTKTFVGHEFASRARASGSSTATEEDAQHESVRVDRESLLNAVKEAIERLEALAGKPWVPLSALQRELDGQPGDPAALKRLLEDRLGRHRLRFDGQQWCTSLASSLDARQMSLEEAVSSAKEVILHVSRSRCGAWVPLHCVKHDLEAKHGDFSPSRWGFGSFRDFLEHAVGPESLDRGDDGKTTVVSLVETTS